DPVSDRNCQCTTASPFASDGADDGDLNARHLPQVAGNGLRLSTFLGAQAGVSTGRVHKCEDGPAEFFSNMHGSQRLAIAFRIRHAKIAVNLLARVAGLLMPDQQHLFTVEAGHATNNCGVVTKSAIAVNLTPLSKDALDIVEKVWALRMTRQLCLFPCVQVRINLLAKRVHALV